MEIGGLRGRFVEGKVHSWHGHGGRIRDQDRPARRGSTLRIDPEEHPVPRIHDIPVIVRGKLVGARRRLTEGRAEMALIRRQSMGD